MSRLLDLKIRWKSLSSLHKGLFQLLLWGSLIVAYVIWQALRMPGAALYVHNHTDRPIFSYFVNDNWGGNAAASGGGMTCCWRIEGETLKVDWIKSMTRTQYEQGAREETLSLNLPNPPRHRGDRYLHVHFFPGDQVRLYWSADLDTPYEHLKDAPAQPAFGDQEVGSR